MTFRTIEILKDYGLINWQMLILGLERNLVTKYDIVNFAVNYLQDHAEEHNNAVYLLAGSENYDDVEIKHLLGQLVCCTRDAENDCLEKWLLAELIILDNEAIAPEEKIERLQDMYVNFDYPSYMRKCSKYGPSQSAIDKGFASCDELTACPLEEMKKVISVLKNKFGIYK